jgi:fucose 4-O-acetylase-like acetyltransferase
MTTEVLNNKNRIEYIDLAKGICIIMVVLFHVAKYYDITLLVNKFFKLIRMPLYFFLSGFFFKSYSGFFDFLKRKTNKLLIPFAFWYLFSVGFYFFVYKIFGLSLSEKCDYVFTNMITAFWVKEDFPNSPVWFLLCLFWVNLLFYVVFLLSKNRKNSLLSVLILSMLSGGIGLLFWCLGINLPAYIDSAFTSVPFFCFGYMVKSTRILEQEKYDRYLLLISAILIVVVGFIAIITGEGYSLKFNKFHVESAIIAYPCGFLGTMAIILFSKKVKRIPVVSMYGRYSIMILVTHIILMSVYDLLLQSVGIVGKMAMWVNLSMILLSYLALIPLMRRFMPHITAQKDIIKV